MYGFLLAQSLSNMAIGIFTLRQQLRGLLSKNWTGTVKTPYVEYLVVGGGGGGGNNGGGAGGGGGVLTGLLPVTTGATNNVTVGGGGVGATTGSANGSSGINSVLNSLIAVGGGYGGGNNTVGGTGGSGGGAGAPPAGSSGVTNAGGQGVSGQGNAGGGGLGGGAGGQAGGGGGAGTVGLNAPAINVAGNGAAGISSAISGTVTPYGGGGGGGTYPNTSTFGTGGVGGGGAGASTASAAGTAGQANTGGGGGGGAGGSGNGGNGGSGIVIVSYPDIYAPLTTTGSPTVSTSGSGSISFNGSSQCFRYAGQTPFVFGTGDFTIESWFYANAFSGFPTLYESRDSTPAGNGPLIYFNSSGTLLFFGNGADRITGSTLSTGQWYHIAVCRIASSTKMYLNGVQTGSTYSDSTNYTCGAASPVIGANGTAIGAYINAYISNLRVVKGVGVYTGTFTPPTSPLQVTQSAGTNIAAITGTQTSLLLSSVSGSYLADGSTNSYAPVAPPSPSIVPVWNQSSPFATGLGYKNRVYTWVNGGGAGTSATGTFTV